MNTQIWSEYQPSPHTRHMLTREAYVNVYTDGRVLICESDQPYSAMISLSAKAARRLRKILRAAQPQTTESPT